MAFLYIIECRGGSLYTGITKDIEKRMIMHRDGIGAKYTRAHPPQRLLAVWETEDLAMAARAEWAMKQWKRKKKEQLLASPARLGEAPFLLPAGVVCRASTVQEKMCGIFDNFAKNY